MVAEKCKWNTNPKGMRGKLTLNDRYHVSPLRVDRFLCWEGFSDSWFSRSVLVSYLPLPPVVL